MTRHASLQAMLARRDRLSAADEALVAAHLDECPDCQERAAAYAAQVAFLRSFRREAAPPHLREKLLTIVDQRTTARRSTWKAREVSQRWPRTSTRALTSVSLRWPSMALAAVLAVAVVVLSPLISQRTASPVSADQLLRSAAQATLTMPSRGSATLTYVRPGDLTQRLVPHHLNISWAATDPQHYRVEVQTLEPALDSGTLTTSVDGSRMTQYDTRTDTAGVRTDAGPFAGLFGLPGVVQPMEVPPNQSIQEYLDSTQKDLPSSVQHFARIVGQERLLGREADVVQFAPVVRGIQCVPRGATWTDCNTPLDYGTATAWIDDATHLILKYQADLTSGHSNVGSSLYHVTSLALGPGATQTELTQHPPVSVQPVPAHPSTGTTGTGGPPGYAPPVPNGFLAASPPAELPNAYTSMETVATPPLGDVTGIDLLFVPTDGQHFSPYLPGEHFLSIQERIRAQGLPARLQTGEPAKAGTCQAWGGTSADGLHTLAFARGTISVFMASDSLSSADLAAYVAQTMCRQ